MQVYRDSVSMCSQSNVLPTLKTTFKRTRERKAAAQVRASATEPSVMVNDRRSKSEQPRKLVKVPASAVLLNNIRTKTVEFLTEPTSKRDAHPSVREGKNQVVKPVFDVRPACLSMSLSSDEASVLASTITSPVRQDYHSQPALQEPELTIESEEVNTFALNRSNETDQLRRFKSTIQACTIRCAEAQKQALFKATAEAVDAIEQRQLRTEAKIKTKVEAFPTNVGSALAEYKSLKQRIATLANKAQQLMVR